MKKIFSVLLLILISFPVRLSGQYIINFAAEFNGNSSYVSIPDHSELNPANELTIEAWIYPRSFSSFPTIIGKNWFSSYWFGLTDAGKLRFYPKGTGSNLDGNAILPLNKWTHVAAVYDGTSTKLFINGKLDASSNSVTGPLVINSDPVYIGCDRDGATLKYFWDGYIDNVRIWKDSRTEVQITDFMFVPLTYWGGVGELGDLVAAYLLDWSADDVSGTVRNNGTLNNVNMVDFRSKPGHHYDFNNSLYFDGNSHCVANNNTDFNATTAITVEAWVRRDLTLPPSQYEFILSKASSTGGGRIDYHLKLMGNNLAFDIGTGGTVEFQNAITDDKWYHIAATYNSADGKSILYIDGNKVAENTNPAKPLIGNNPDSLYIGRAGIGVDDLGARFKGSIDEVRIWADVARTDEQIKSTMFASRSFTDGASQSCTFSFDTYTNRLYTRSSGLANGTPLIFRGNVKINSSKMQSTYNSPMLFPAGDYQQSAFLLSNRKVPVISGGTVVDSLLVSGSSLKVDNLQMVIMLNHGLVGALDITLQSPDGYSVKLTPSSNINYTSNDLIAVLDQSADSTLQFTNLNLAPFSPRIKPSGNLWGFLGKKADGWWKIIVSDASTGDMLRVINAWGLNLQTSTQVQYTVTTSSNPAEYGSTSGGGTYAAGTTVTVSAAAKFGYSFVNWTEGTNVVSSSANYSFVLNSNRNLVANFTVTPTLLVTPDFVNVSKTAGTGVFNVSNTSGGTMPWTAASNVSWLRISSGDSGTNSGTIAFSYEANSGSPRTGIITVTAPGALGSPKTVEVRQEIGVGVDDLLTGIPVDYCLYQNYPNPFNPSTLIRYGIPVSGHVRIAVFDVIGNVVALLVNKYQNAGYYEVQFNSNGSPISAGVYFYQITSGKFSQVKKMLIIK